jgi:response regulator RpfG family c-di-GMP phosphodiesterase
MGKAREGEKRSQNNIMLVDDEPDMLLTYKTLLSSENYNMQCILTRKKRYIASHN